MTVNELFASRPADFVIHAADHQKLEWQEIGRFRYEFNEQTSSNEQVKKQKFAQKKTFRYPTYTAYKRFSFEEKL